VRLGRLEPGQVIGERGVPAAGPTQLGSGARVDLLVDRLVRFTLHDLAGGEAKSLCSRSPPPAGRLPGLRGADVVATRRPACGLALGLPDVVKVVALRDGDDHGQPAASSQLVARPRD
jgi:hypothetical protein